MLLISKAQTVMVHNQCDRDAVLGALHLLSKNKFSHNLIVVFIENFSTFYSLGGYFSPCNFPATRAEQQCQQIVLQVHNKLSTKGWLDSGIAHLATYQSQLTTACFSSFKQDHNLEVANGQPPPETDKDVFLCCSYVDFYPSCKWAKGNSEQQKLCLNPLSQSSLYCCSPVVLRQ